MRAQHLQAIRQRFDAVIFDLDGTLVDTAPDILDHLNDMLGELGRSGLDLDTVRPMIGDGVKRLLIRGLEASGGMLDDLDLDAQFECYLRRYAEDPARRSRPYDGVVETLTALGDVGIRLGVCTNKPQTPTDRLLRTLGLDRHFGAVIGGDALPSKKPDPAHMIAVLDRLEGDPARAVLIGDSETDLKTARAAGTPCVLVTFGYTATPAGDLGANRTIDHYESLLPTLAGL